MILISHPHRDFEKRHCFVFVNEAGPVEDAQPEAIDSKGETPEGLELNLEEFDTIDNAKDKSDQQVEETKQKSKVELSYWQRALVALEIKTETLSIAQTAFDNGDTGIATRVYAEVSNLSRAEAIAIYNLPASTPAGSEAIAAMYKIGMKMTDYEDIKRAQQGEPTMQNMDLELAEADVKEIKKILLGDSLTDQFVKKMTGQKELEGYQRVLLSPANAIEGVATGVIKLPGTLKTLAKMSTEMAENADLNAMGVKADVIMKIIDQYFSPTEKIAMIAQFIGEGIVSGGVGGALSKLGKAPRIANILAKVSKMKFAKVALASAKVGVKAGTSRTVGRGVSAYDRA